MTIPATDVIFTPAGTGAVNRTVQDKLLDFINVRDYGAVGDGVADDTDAFRDAIAFAAGRPVHVPAGTYIISEQIQVLAVDTVGAAGPGLHLIGDGMVASIIQNHCDDESLFYLDATVTSPVHSQMGVCVEKLTVTRTGFASTGSTAFEIHNCYQARFDQVQIRGQSGHGIELLNGSVADDGWNMVSLNNVWIEGCLGWGIKADGTSGRNEGSATICRNVFIQSNGVNEYKAVTAITQANPGVVTAAAHGFTTGQKIKIFDVAGMTEVNGQTFTATVIDANSFSIGVNTSAYGAYVSGGETAPQIPGSGGMIWKGQLLQLLSSGFTLNQNVGFFVKGQAGLGVGVLCEQVTWENNYRRHVYSTGIDNWRSTGCQFHGNSTFKTHVGVEYDSSDFLVRGVVWDGTVVRANQGNGVQWKLTGPNTNHATCRIYSSLWQDFDYAGQRRFEGWQFDQVEEDCILRIVGDTSLLFGPTTGRGSGNKTAVRLRGPTAQTNPPGGVTSTTGEWIEYSVPSSGIFRNTNGLAPSTIYNVYIYDNTGAVALEFSTTGHELDPLSGYNVMIGDHTKRWVGRVRTTADSPTPKFVMTNAGYLAPSTLAGSLQGTVDWMWQDIPNQKLWIKGGGLPSSASGGQFAFSAPFEASATYDPPSLAAGASATTTLAATCSLGDYVNAVSFSLDSAGVTFEGYVSAANVITVVLTNTTAGTVDLGSGTLRAIYQRR